MMILYLTPINHMTKVNNLEEINQAINTMVIFRRWRHDQDGWEHIIEEEMISFFPSIEKATDVAKQWVERGKKKEFPNNFNRFTAFVIPIDKKLNGRRLVNNRITGFESDFEVGDHF